MLPLLRATDDGDAAARALKKPHKVIDAACGGGADADAEGGKDDITRLACAALAHAAAGVSMPAAASALAVARRRHDARRVASECGAVVSSRVASGAGDAD